MYYVFNAAETSIPSVRVLRGMSPPKITGGYARWDITERPKRKSVTQFAGTDPIVLSLPVLFDGLQAGQPVEADIANLWRMRHVIGATPPVVTVAGGIPTPAKGIQWVIQQIEETDNAIWQSVGGSVVRFRQEATVTLLEKVSPTLVALPTAQPGNTRGTVTSAHKPGRHQIKDGETAESIAHKHGITKVQLLNANDLRDPRVIKTMVGKVLVIP